MSKKARCQASAWSDFKRNVLAGSKSRDMSAVYGSSIPFQHSRPFRRSKRVRSNKDAADRASCEPSPSTPLSFTKVLLSKSTVHTSECCRIILPSEFCNKHNMERNVTMTDSSGLRVWHMRFQSCDSSRHRESVISNGWREFAYDHSLKINDRLVFTVMSTSHFVVEFATSKGFTRAMLPKRNGNDYPWRINYSRLDCLSSADLQGGKKKRICKNVQDDEDDEEYANKRPASTPRSFMKILTLKCGTHTTKCCRLTLPREFCEKHNVESYVTMTDSTGHRLWHMRVQSCGMVTSTRPRVYCISNGWREFSYDHSLKVNDMLVFTLLSTSLFLVEFATSTGSTRAMLPTKDGKHYPWQIKYARLECLSVAGDKSRKKRKVHLKEAELQCVKKKRIHKNVQDDEDDEENAYNGPASTPRSFTIISLNYGIHTARICRLTLPREICETHNVEKIVTMTDSKGHRIWHMRMQSSGFVSSTRPRVYCISNGWREFSYDHSLKADDRLVFTLLSTSHFLVEFATSNGSTRAVPPTKDGKDYPWQINFAARVNCLSVAGDQSGKKRKVQKTVTSSIVIRHKQIKAQKMKFCQCNQVETVGKEMNSTKATRKEYVRVDAFGVQECRWIVILANCR